jgi:hypothetical protein
MTNRPLFARSGQHALQTGVEGGDEVLKRRVAFHLLLAVAETAQGGPGVCVSVVGSND